MLLAVLLLVALSAGMVARVAIRPQTIDRRANDIGVILALGWGMCAAVYLTGRAGLGLTAVTAVAVWVVVQLIVVPNAMVGRAKGLAEFAAAPPRFTTPPSEFAPLVEAAAGQGFLPISDGCYLSTGGYHTSQLLRDDAGRVLEIQGRGQFAAIAVASRTAEGELLVTTERRTALEGCTRFHERAEDECRERGDRFVPISESDAVLLAREHDRMGFEQSASLDWWSNVCLMIAPWRFSERASR